MRVRTRIIRSFIPSRSTIQREWPDEIFRRFAKRSFQLDRGIKALLLFLSDRL